MTHRLAILGLSLLLSQPCSRTAGEGGGTEQTLPVVMVAAHSANSGWSDATTLQYRDSASLAAAWDTLFAGGPQPPVAYVNFDAHRAMIVTAGTQPTGGFRVDYDSARVEHDTLRLLVTLRTPPPECAVTQELTAPAVALIIPPAPMPVRIVRRVASDTVSCR